MNIPSKKTCIQLMQKMKMFPHIMAHSTQVCRVAVFFTDRLIAQKIDLTRDLVSTSALLHDITKTRALETGENHAATGEKLLVELGYSQIGAIVGQHVLLDNFNSCSAIDEAFLVNYADKRVLHDKITTLSERMEYIIERYGNKSEKKDRYYKLWEETRQMEKKLFDQLDFHPDSLPEKMDVWDNHEFDEILEIAENAQKSARN
ncbi:metal-dependent phosphohydrolase [Desulfobacterales bacterium HSG16]|nr:metal-dependent phosphohydrolase [Desulfobacterales bacterium HSG16]